jgi:hypothetical protein
VDYLAWPIVENPWMRQTDAERFELTDGVHRRTYDFEQWTVTEGACPELPP